MIHHRRADTPAPAAFTTLNHHASTMRFMNRHSLHPRWIFVALLALPFAGASLRAQAAPAPAPDSIVAPPPMPGSGTENVIGESGWKARPGDAEREASSRLDAEVRRVTQQLYGQGRRVIGGVTYAVTFTERRMGGSAEYQARMRRQINWVSNAPSRMALLERVRLAQANTGNNKAMSPVVPGQEQVAALIAPASGVPAGEEITYLEEELARRALAKPALAGRYSPTFSAMKITRAAVTVGDEVVTLPSAVVTDQFTIENHTDAAQTRHYQKTLRVTESEGYSFAKSVQSTDNVTATLSYSPANAAGFGGSIQGSKTWQMTIAKTTSHQLEQSKEFAESFDLVVDPHTALTNTITREVIRQSFSLRGPITFDGTITTLRTVKDVYACGPFGTKRCSRQKTTSYADKLSDILSPEERTVSVDGKVTLATAESTRSTSVVNTRKLDVVAQ